MHDTAVANVCFHGVGTPRRPLELGEDVYWVDRSQFLRILDEIAGWPATAISFDDGNASDIEIGLPALVDRGLTATFFPLAGRLGSPGSLGHDEVRELSRRGMQVGSHGMSHRPWRGMDGAALRAELVDARHVIGAAAGAPVTQAALPLGRYDRRVLSALRELGYERVHTSDRRLARHTSWLQPRFSVRQQDTAESFRAQVLTPPTWPRRVRLDAVGLVKRLR